MLVKCFHKFRIYEFTIFLWFFFCNQDTIFHKKNFAENKTFFCENKFWIRENISQTCKLQSFLTFFFNFVSQNWNLLFKIRHGFIALEAFWALKKETSPLLRSGYLPHVALDLLLGGPTYLPLWGDVVYEWSLRQRPYVVCLFAFSQGSMCNVGTS